MNKKTFHCTHMIENPDIKTTKAYDVYAGHFPHEYHTCESCMHNYVHHKPESFAKDNNGWAVQVS